MTQPRIIEKSGLRTSNMHAVPDTPVKPVFRVFVSFQLFQKTRALKNGQVLERPVKRKVAGERLALMFNPMIDGEGQVAEPFGLIADFVRIACDHNSSDLFFEDGNTFIHGFFDLG